MKKRINIIVAILMALCIFPVFGNDVYAAGGLTYLEFSTDFDDIIFVEDETVVSPVIEIIKGESTSGAVIEEGSGIWEVYDEVEDTWYPETAEKYYEGKWRYSFVVQLSAEDHYVDENTYARVDGDDTSWKLEVLDSEGKEALITSPVFDVVTKKLISLVEAKSENLNVVVSAGKDIKDLTFEVSSADPVKISGEWQRYDPEGDVWNKAASSKFYDGQYRYAAKVRIEEASLPYYRFVDPVKLIVNGKEWGYYGMDTDAEGFYVQFVSPTLSVDEHTINTISAYGVIPPVVGQVPNNYSIQLKEDDLEIVDVSWFSWKDGELKYLPSGEAFQAEYNYQIQIRVKAKEGYQFADSIYSSINDMTYPLPVTVTDGEYRALQMLVPFAEEAGRHYVVTASMLNVRTGPSFDSDRLGGFLYGKVVRAYGVQDGFTNVAFDETNGFVDSQYLALTFSKDTAFEDGPAYFTVAAGAMNVRADISTSSPRIGGVTSGKQVLGTGMRKNGNENWLVTDYYDSVSDTHQLGYILFSKDNGGGSVTYYFTGTDVPPTKIEAALDKAASQIVSDGVPAKVTIKSLPAPVIANDESFGLNDANIACSEDGVMSVKIYPDDDMNFKTIGKDDIKLPADYTVNSYALVEDGSLEIFFSPSVPVKVSFVSNGGSAVADRIIAKGKTVTAPEDPEKKNYYFDGWFKDASLNERFDFNETIDHDLTLYARWMNIVYGIDLNCGGAYKNEAGNYELKLKKLDLLFKDGFKDVKKTVSLLRYRIDGNELITDVPEKGEEYYFDIELEDPGIAGRLDCYFDDGIKDGFVLKMDDGKIEIKDVSRSPDGLHTTVRCSYEEYPVSYTVTKGADGSWKKDSSQKYEMVIKRSLSDDKTYGLFEKVEVDGVKLDNSSYKASSGSLILRFETSFLKSLSLGSHEVKVSFSDGDVKTKLSIVKASAKEDKKPGYVIPLTGIE